MIRGLLRLQKTSILTTAGISNWKLLNNTSELVKSSFELL